MLTWVWIIRHNYNQALNDNYYDLPMEEIMFFKSIKNLLSGFFGYLLLFVFIILFLFGDLFIKDFIQVPNRLLDVNTIFLSILLEAIPFILLGVFVSAVIQVFIHEDMLKRYIPSNPIIALFPAVIMGAIFPICECAIVPIVRRLIKKGMPLHVGFVILVSAPILNPIVFLSTYHAFRSNLMIAYARMGLAFVAALIIGAIIYYFYRNSYQLKEPKSLQQNIHVDHYHNKRQKIKDTFYHASDEFFDMGKFLIIGALVASLVQAFLPRELLVEIGNGTLSGPLVMMGLAYILSLCSEADAFVASSFKQLVSPSALVAFLVYGPMIDLKNTILMIAYFRLRFVIGFIIIVTVTVFLGVLIVAPLLV